MRLFLSFCCFFSFNLLGSILPPNNLYLEDDINKDANIDEALFEKIIEGVISYYKPIVKSHGARLVPINDWEDPEVNAYAKQVGNEWQVKMYGGLARRDEVTEDGFALVVCHELGHHLGGFPFKEDKWAASEGQSDYFATQSCARNIWKNEKTKNANFREEVNRVAKIACDSAWPSIDDQNLCYRVAMAGHSLATLLGALRNADELDFATPDTNEVSISYQEHPAAQCRLDTYFQGSLCNVAFDENVIPGVSHPSGQGSFDAESLISKYSCTSAGFHSIGRRSRCWFKPNVNLATSIAGVNWLEIEGNGNGYVEPGERYQISTNIGNYTSIDLESVQSTLSSPSGNADIRIANSTYSNIISGDFADQDTAFEIKISNNAKCGSSIPFNVDLNYNEFQNSSQFSATLGRKEISQLFINDTALDIPDNDEDGVESVVVVSEEGRYEKITIDVNITHTYIGDLIVKLISPNNNKYLLHNKEGTNGDNIRKTYEVDLRESDVSGDWRLKVVDTANIDKGSIEGYSLAFHKHVCM